MINLHHLIDSKAQLYVTVLVCCRSIDTAKSFPRRYRGGCVAMADGVFQTGRFKLFFLKEAIDVALLTLLERSWQIHTEVTALDYMPNLLTTGPPRTMPLLMGF